MESLTGSETSCISRCFENRHCLSIGYITSSNKCHLYGNQVFSLWLNVFKRGGHGISKKNLNAKTHIFPSRISQQKNDFVVTDLRVTANRAHPSNGTVDLESCRKTCLADVSCDVFTFCSDKNNWKSESSNCRLYSSKTLLTFKKAEDHKKMRTYFVSRF